MKRKKRSTFNRYSDNQISALYLFAFALSVFFLLLAFISYFSSLVKCSVLGALGIAFLFISSCFWKEIKQRVEKEEFTEKQQYEEPIEYGFDQSMFEEKTSVKKHYPSHAKPSNKKIKYAVLIGIAFVIAVSGFWIAFGQGIFSKDIPISSEIPVSEIPDSSSRNALDVIGDVEVENNLFTVMLTVPADFAEGITQEKLDESVADGTVNYAVLNDDGSVTYQMSKNQHKKLLEVVVEEINDSLAEMVASEDLPMITDIKANDSFTKFTITTSSTELTIRESLSILNFYTLGGTYAIFSGKEVDNIHVDFVNAETGEIIESADSKDFADEN